MTRRSQQKADTHSRILQTAARAFREEGAGVSGIGSVMTELGLTKGGFYRHFKSKDDLFAEAVAEAFREIGDSTVAAAETAQSPDDGLRVVINRYLSLRHLEHPGQGCVYATLTPEIARQSPAVRRRIDAAIDAFCDRLLPWLPGANDDEKRANFRILFPAMAGVLASARALPSTADRERLLSSARGFFFNAFSASKGNQ